jgi:hypothetical protein
VLTLESIFSPVRSSFSSAARCSTHRLLRILVHRKFSSQKMEHKRGTISLIATTEKALRLPFATLVTTAAKGKNTKAA